MTITDTTAPTDKKAYLVAIATCLIKKFGKKNYYEPEEVEKAHKESKWSTRLDLCDCALSLFSSHEDYDAYHAATGEAGDYIGTKTALLQEIAAPGAESWMAVPELDLDASWLLLGEVFGGVLEGVGELFAGIGDALS